MIADVRDWFTRIAKFHCFAHTDKQRLEMVEEMIAVVKAEVAQAVKRERLRQAQIAITISPVSDHQTGTR